MRKRKNKGLTVYNYEKRYTIGGERIQEMRSLTAVEYFSHCKRKDSSKIALQKDRICFVYKTQSFILEKYVNVPGQPTVLRVETNVEDVELPPFINIEKEITKDLSYSSDRLAEVMF